MRRPLLVRAEEHDDHCWLTVAGAAYKIQHIARSGPLTVLCLARGYWPHIEFVDVDVSGVNWPDYSAKADFLMRQRFPHAFAVDVNDFLYVDGDEIKRR